ncbi:secreted glycosyl hydrolase [Propionibacterium freudenreichii]|nr:secreted glycosyl hydrolase [Propionibacterium freudenreichii]CEI24954.1 secreted glycosyl hydrolase [Propionibacterium freudenreichii]
MESIVVTPRNPHRSHRPRLRRASRLAVFGMALALVTACSASPGGAGGSTSARDSTSGTTSPSASAASGASSLPPRACLDAARAMDPQARVELLYMGSVTATTPAAGAGQLANQPVGSVILMGDPGSLQATSQLTDALGAARPGLLIATDQEGGQVQRLTGPGLDQMPSARQQSTLATDALTQRWTSWGAQLRRGGVHYNLAPSADLVPRANRGANAPIGQLDRGYGATRADVATNVTAVLAGMHAGGVVGAVKHFPGLGNVSVNTDFGAAHDAVTTPDSDELNTFADVLAGADSVMVSSVVYDRIDPAGPAAFSSRVVSGLLREQLGYSRVIISDDLGAAVALADYPVAQRGTLFLRAGGDLALDVDPASVPAMVADTRAAVAADPDFAEQTVAKAARVLQLRADAGLGQCGA